MVQYSTPRAVAQSEQRELARPTSRPRGATFVNCKVVCCDGAKDVCGHGGEDEGAGSKGEGARSEGENTERHGQLGSDRMGTQLEELLRKPLRLYKHFFFVNCGVRGPFFHLDFGSPTPRAEQWLKSFTDRLSSSVLLVGPTVSCQLDTPHVQSYAVAMTQATYKLHLSYSHSYAGLSDEERQVVSDTFHRLAKMPFA